MIAGSSEARKSANLTVKKPKLQSWDNVGRKLDSNHWQPTKCLWGPFGISTAKHLILLDPSKIKMVSYSKMRTFWEESVSKIFQTKSLQHHQTHEWYICVRKMPSLQTKSSYCSCKNIKGCRLWRNPSWSAQNLEARSSLAASCVSSDLLFWKDSERLANWGDHPTHKKWDRKDCTNYRYISL